MNKLLYILFLSIFLLDYLSIQLGLLPRLITWLPEIISMLVILIISIRVTLGYGKFIPPICSIFLVLFLLNIIIGAAINLVPIGPLIAGFRVYLKSIPLFILPFVYHFSDQQINKQIYFLFFLTIIQTPISLYQRFVLSKGYLTGDLVRGTLATSGVLTAFLTCAIAILMAFYLAKRINLKSFIFLFIMLFIPMTMNETKSTIILLPIAIVLPIFFSSSGLSIKQFIPMIILGLFAAIAFVFIYDYFISERYFGIGEFLTGEGKVERYLYSGVEAGTHVGNVGRIDSLILAFQTLSKNTLNLLFGLGIGNVSESFIPSLSGEYAEEYSSYNVKFTQVTLVLWELGVFGVLLYYVLFFMVFKYSRRLSVHDSFIGTLASGWSAVSLLIMISMLYKSILNENATSYLFWYFSGYIISEHFKYNRTSI